MSRSRTSPLTRRGLLAAGGAAGLSALLAACGEDGGGSGSGEGGAWSFTDDRKKKVELDGQPKRIVAFTGTAAALHDFGVDDQVVGVFGPTKLKNGKPDPQAGELDVDKLEIIGNAYGEFNIEKYAKLRPDLLITNTYEPNALWFVPEESKGKILKLAPSVAIKASRVSLLTIINRYAELAESLGADPKAKKITDAKARFEKAAETLRKAAKAKGGLKVMAASGSRDLFYVSTPKVNADLMYLRELGVDLVVPKKLDQAGYFEPLSWENADKYHADVIMLDNRGQALQPDALEKVPAWTDLPAVKADQVIPWASEPRFSYAGSLPLLENLAKTVQDAKKTG
ncbi:ABC transporter substrate-binding protein [Streptomyces armeniacus]|uniref:ABC transporter substrate-binding protein n=1 Tax=Streptomyces armeniacus TaxID=83291 RepID=A0A345XW26_9ACTN|nr:ABC transporter substrate-binding protein [Streptomyces armeniacus]AXK35842.1 ABC transporter substrate-binding protein [Streptomyces armeniacus]